MTDNLRDALKAIIRDVGIAGYYTDFQALNFIRDHGPAILAKLDELDALKAKLRDAPTGDVNYVDGSTVIIGNLPEVASNAIWPKRVRIVPGEG